MRISSRIREYRQRFVGWGERENLLLAIIMMFFREEEEEEEQGEGGKERVLWQLM